MKGIFYMFILSSIVFTEKLKYVEEFQMVSANYDYSNSKELSENHIGKSDLKLILNPKNAMSHSFLLEILNERREITTYLVDQPFINKQIDSNQIESEFDKYFPLIIENWTNENLSIANDEGISIMQEALNEYGEWAPIEYLTMSENLNYYSVKLPTMNKMEVAVPRYKGKYKTQLRIKVSIQGLGILTSNPFEGSINKGQFKKPKEKNIRNRIKFLE